MRTYVKAPIEILETERLVLRPVALADAPRIQELFPHWNVLVYMAAAIPWPYPPDGAVSFLTMALPKIEAREEYYWAILERGREDEGLIGIVGLTPASDSDNRGFWLGEEFWGRGLMAEASTAVTDFGFNVLQMEDMILGNAEPNRASHRLKERCGAVIVRMEERPYIGGVFPAVVWQLTREAWARFRSECGPN